MPWRSGVYPLEGQWFQLETLSATYSLQYKQNKYFLNLFRGK